MYAWMCVLIMFLGTITYLGNAHYCFLGVMDTG